MIYSTKGIVLRQIKYGETSLIVSIYTEIFGLQSYLMNGVRTSGKTSKAHFFQPASILDLQVYHNELKNLQRIKEVKWFKLYENIFSDVIKNSVTLFIVELLFKCLKQPEANTPLYEFCEDALLQLDTASSSITANFPLYFALQLAVFLGIEMQDNYSTERNLFDLNEGKFIAENNEISHQFNKESSYAISQLLKAIHPNDLTEIKLSQKLRVQLLKDIEKYYQWHIPDFGKMKTLEVLHTLF